MDVGASTSTDCPGHISTSLAGIENKNDVQYKISWRVSNQDRVFSQIAFIYYYCSNQLLVHRRVGDVTLQLHCTNGSGVSILFMLFITGAVVIVERCRLSMLHYALPRLTGRRHYTKYSSPRSPPRVSSASSLN